MRRNAPLGSVVRSSPVTVVSPVISPAAREAGSRRSGGTKPRLTRIVEPVLGRERRQDPEARAIVGDRGNQRLAIVQEMPGDGHAAVFVVLGVDRRPFRRPRRRNRRGVDALLDAIDQVELPGPALDLPDAERREANDAEKRKKADDG